MRLIGLCLCLFLAACSNGKPQALYPLNVRENTLTIAVHVATTRVPDGDRMDFTDKRGKVLAFQQVVVSIPPIHKEGEIEWPQTYPGSPLESFVVTRNERQSAETFVAAVENSLPPSGEALVFVHGYNTHHEEAVFRLAQMANDARLAAASVAFIWPSRGEFTDYVTDRESSLAARNRLYEALVLLSKSPKIRKINLFSHSMGAMLTLETLVQAKLRGNSGFGGKLDALVLASPDIDVDVFLSQMEIIGNRHKPTIILTARNDRALSIARRLAGNVVRVGAASTRDPASVEAMARYGLTVIDMTRMETSDATNHTKFASSPAFLQQLGGVLERGLTRDGSNVGDFIVDTAGRILDAPANVLRRVVQ